MTKTITKPSFREEEGIIYLDDVKLAFNSQRVGPLNFSGLRQEDYGNGFRMPIMPELVHLVYASLENQDYDTAKNVVITLKRNWLTGNTGILYVPDGMFVWDKPNLRDGRISMDQKDLEARLGSYEERGVVFSDDRSVRFTQYGFVKREQSSLALSENLGVIALVGGEENAEKIARASEHYKLDPWFCALSNVKSLEIKVAGLISDNFGSRLYVNAYGGEGFVNGSSFVVRESGEATRAEK